MPSPYAFSHTFVDADAMLNVDVVNDFIDRLNLAVLATGRPFSPFPNVTPGQDAGVASNWAAGMQAMVVAYAGYPDLNSFTRKYERSFTSLAAATYNDGTTAPANGDLARFGGGTPPFAVGDGRTYLRVAGAWVVQPIPTLPGLIVKHGRALFRDVIGPWIYNELRDGINAIH